MCDLTLLNAIHTVHYCLLVRHNIFITISLLHKKKLRRFCDSPNSHSALTSEMLAGTLRTCTISNAASNKNN